MSLFEPEGLWSGVRARLGERGLPGWLVLIPLLGALGVTAAVELGVRTFDTDWHPVFGYSARPDDGGARFRALWIALAATPVIQGVATALLGPLYGQPRRWREALAVAIVGNVPLYFSGIALLWLPGILLVIVAFFVSYVWWVTGVRELLGVPPSESTEFVMITVIASSSALFLLSSVLPL